MEQTQLNVVALETLFCPLAQITVPAPYTCSVTEYNRTGPQEIAARIKDADIIITTILKLDADVLSVQVSPRLKLIAVQASGTDSVNLAKCSARGIRVVNSPGCNITAVAEHALALYFAARRSLLPTMYHARSGNWPTLGSLMLKAHVAGQPPRGCRDETVVIVGYGSVGRCVEGLFRALGARVLISGRKGDKTMVEDRLSFDEALRTATVLVLCCPLTPDTVCLISSAEFAAMRSDSVLVNVSRGGIVGEAALIRALMEEQIAGAAVDVFDTEPGNSQTSPLLAEETAGLNLVTTPHVAWIGMNTTTNYQRVLQENIDGFLNGYLAQERIKA